MDADLPSVRHHLAVLARRKKARTLGWPRDWRPSEVCNPEDGQPFTPAGVWEFIVHLLEERHDIPIELVELWSSPRKVDRELRVFPFVLRWGDVPQR
jgi:hypothetical protein